LLQLIEGSRQGRLRDAKHFGNDAELAVLAERHEHLQVPQSETI
jgi:hypothetical protein